MKTRRELLENLLEYFEVITNKPSTPKYRELMNQFIYNEIKISNEDLEIVFTALKDTLKKYPTRVEINEAIADIKKNKSKYKKPSIATPKSVVHEKTKGELLGLPTSIESLCIMIEEGKADSGAFKWAINTLGITDKDLWDIYEARAEGKLHPVVETYRKIRGYVK